MSINSTRKRLGWQHSSVKNPKDKIAFDAHWDKILNSSQITKRTIVAEGQVAL